MFLNVLKKETNATTTQNGDKAYKSTLNHNLDVFAFSGGAHLDKRVMRKAKKAFIKALNEDKELALRNLINVRNFRDGGMGERQLFRDMYITMDEDTQIKMLPLVPEIGRWDDVVEIIKTTQYGRVKRTGYALIQKQLNADYVAMTKDEPISLLVKWLPSDKGSKTTQENRKFIRELGFPYRRDYRKMLSALRPKLKLVETELSQKRYDIDFNKVPSRAFNKYQNAFWRHLNDQMEAYIESVNKGEKKIKMAGVTPDEVVHHFMKQSMYALQHDKNVAAVAEAQWKSLSDLSVKPENTLVMADVSGSMWFKPLEVSIGLAIYFAEQMTGEFHNHFMTFSERPELIELSNNMSLEEKVTEVFDANWGMNTDLNKAFNLILSTACKNKVPQEDMPKTLLIISDMQFDSSWGDKSTFETAKREFEQMGYKLPNIVFWNVAGDTAPVTENEDNVGLLSGFTPTVMETIMTMDLDKLTPINLMLTQLNKDKYTDMLKTVNLI